MTARTDQAKVVLGGFDSGWWNLHSLIHGLDKSRKLNILVALTGGVRQRRVLRRVVELG